MSEYIDREAAIAWFMPYAHAGESIEADVVISDIKGMKAADVAPVRHAKVIDKISDDHEIIKPWDYRYYCSACKIPMRESWFKYCPNCGAKMDLEAT